MYQNMELSKGPSNTSWSVGFLPGPVRSQSGCHVYPGKQLSSFDRVTEFDRGRIVAYRDCGLSFREIGSRVG
ncbi:hypothetical protein LAZ67_9000276 [Cordylochernes scorpioides]|uniref:Tc3 transposase DNA binding domain-containing protein n=1 Tax=Cordylochernes scorpioides TaxID=51811 RepID=A0ABY6KSC9_9ARAC|nr:hypothetical protein LAZ67_9000276 [Cordylochernes scorpioides]